MDFDLFELEEDDDIFGSLHFEPTQTNLEATNKNINDFPEFQCNGDDSNNAQFSDEGFIKNAFVTSSKSFTTQNIAEHINLSPYGFSFKQIAGCGVAHYLFGEVFINVQHLVVSVQGAPLGNMYENAETTTYQRRQHITRLLHLVLHCTHKEQWMVLRSKICKLRDLFNRICTRTLWKSIYYANSCKGNECNVPAYHLLHGLLEWKLLDLFILYKYEVLAKDSTSESGNRDLDSSLLKIQLARIFDELLTCSLLLFAKKRRPELLHGTPFPCTCFKELWLVLLLALRVWLSSRSNEREDLCFWMMFNKAMLELKLKIESFSISLLSYYEFATWMFVALTRLHGYRSNGIYEGPQYASSYLETFENCEFIEETTQKFLTLKPNEEQLRTHLCLITPIFLDWHRPRASIPMLLWEYFHKCLNSLFYCAGAAPCNLAVACGSGRAYLERYRTLLTKSQTGPPDANLSSYTLFTLLLGRCLIRLRTLTNANQSQKLLGRIYSKFSMQKFLTLNESGIHHLIELFLILALCGEFKDLILKLRDSLLSITLDKVTTQRQVAVMKGHVALLILCAEDNCDFSEYITKLLQQLNSVKNDISVSKILADGLLDIIQHSGRSFQYGEHLLIDAWLPVLMQNSTPVEQDRIFEALHLIFVKLEIKTNDFITDNNNTEIIQSLYTHILPFIKQKYTNSFNERLPQLAADFCINIEISSFHKLLNFFIETPTVSRQALPQLLLKILENESRSRLVDSTIVMHTWLKSLVLLSPSHTIVQKLTKHAIELPEFNKITNLAADDILQAKEPLCVFIAAVGKAYDNADYSLRCEIADKFNAYVRNFEKWLTNGNDNKQQQLEQQTETTFRFYSFIAIVIYNCPHIVYGKSKNSCFFHVAITRFILPTSVQIGKMPEGKLTQLVHKIFPVLLQGIGRLNFKTDSYLQKTLGDLLLKWTPLFKTISNNTKLVSRPFITCFQSENFALSLFISERLTSLFITTQRRQADPNACLVISIFQEIVNSIAQDAEINQTKDAAIQRLETFLKGTCLLTIEHIMMVDEIVPSRGMLLELFRRIIDSTIFCNSTSLQEIFIEHLRIITKKHLAYYTFFYFDLLMKIAKISYKLIEKIMDFLIEEIRIVEQKRGSGEDNRIRKCLQQLKQCIFTEKSKNQKAVCPAKLQF